MTRLRRAVGCGALLLASLLAPAHAQTLAHRNWAGSGITVDPWWRGAAFYQLDPLTFQDSDGDGFGDLRGLTAQLDYLQTLGVDALVLAPFPLRSPKMALSGQPFESSYGTEDDFARLLAEATAHHLRILVDLPLDQAHTAEDTLSAARFWLTRGVAGLRLSPAPTERPLSPAEGASRLRALRLLCASYPGARVLLAPGNVLTSTDQALWQSFPAGKSRHHARRSMPAAPFSEVSANDRTGHATQPQAAVLRVDVAPATWKPGAAESAEASGRQSAALWTALLAREASLGRSTHASESAPAAELLATDVADAQRSLVRLGDGAHNAALARLQAALLVLGPDDPLLLYGQELGIVGIGAAAPMPWTPTTGTPDSFTTGVPWVDMAPDATTVNVQLEQADSDSLLGWYQHLLLLRHTESALHSGALSLLTPAQPGIVAFMRTPPAAGATLSAPVVVVANLSPRAVLLSLVHSVAATGIRSTPGGLLRTLLSTDPAQPVGGAVTLNGIVVPAFGLYVGAIKPPPGLESVLLAPHTSRRSR